MCGKVWKMRDKSLEKVWKKCGKCVEKVWENFGQRLQYSTVE